MMYQPLFMLFITPDLAFTHDLTPFSISGSLYLSRQKLQRVLILKKRHFIFYLAHSEIEKDKLANMRDYFQPIQFRFSGKALLLIQANNE